MEKTLTKAEVERVLDEEFSGLRKSKERILNELFPPEFKVSVGEYYKLKPELGDIVKVESVNDLGWFWGRDLKTPYIEGSEAKNHHNPRLAIQRHATPEEIAAAEWEEGKEYRVWTPSCVKLVRVASDKVGYFYLDGLYEGESVKIDKYEKL